MQNLAWDSASSIPQPHVKNVCPKDLFLMSEDGLKVAAAGDQEDEDDVDHLANAANEMFPPQGIISRSK